MRICSTLAEVVGTVTAVKMSKEAMIETPQSGMAYSSCVCEIPNPRIQYITPVPKRKFGGEVQYEYLNPGKRALPITRPIPKIPIKVVRFTITHNMFFQL